MQSSAPKSKAKRKAKAKGNTFTVHGIRIKEIRPGYFQIRSRRKGEAEQITHHTTLEAAKLKAEQIHRERVQHGLSSFALTPTEREAARQALDLLEGRAGLIEVARYWIDHHPTAGAVTLSEAVEAYLEDMTRRKCRPATVAGSRARLGRLSRDYGTWPVNAITEADLSEWLDLNGRGPQNRNNDRATFAALWTFAGKKGMAARNPAAGVERVKIDERIPDHWPVARIETVLRAAQVFAPELVPMLAIMAFAGLRPDEARRLDWSSVNLPGKIIRVMPGTSKIRRARNVDLSDNLVEWLAPYRRKSGPVSPPVATMTRWRQRIAAAAVVGIAEVQRRLDQRPGKRGTEIKVLRLGWDQIVEDARAKGETWPPDILRHSFASHWMAVHADIARLADQMGTSPGIIARHYRGLATAKEGKAYFDITPEPGGQIIRLERTA